MQKCTRHETYEFLVSSGAVIELQKFISNSIVKSIVTFNIPEICAEKTEHNNHVWNLFDTSLHTCNFIKKIVYFASNLIFNKHIQSNPVVSATARNCTNRCGTHESHRLRICATLSLGQALITLVGGHCYMTDTYSFREIKCQAGTNIH
jgi:hypothetical protein